MCLYIYLTFTLTNTCDNIGYANAAKECYIKQTNLKKFNEELFMKFIDDCVNPKIRETKHEKI